MLALSYLECWVLNTGIAADTDKVFDKCVLNEWTNENPFVNNFFLETFDFQRGSGILHNERMFSLVLALQKESCTLALEIK